MTASDKLVIIMVGLPVTGTYMYNLTISRFIERLKRTRQCFALIHLVSHPVHSLFTLYEEVFLEESAHCQDEKMCYCYPCGESYMDITFRLEPLAQEMKPT
jgi:hypothetical protein